MRRLFIPLFAVILGFAAAQATACSSDDDDIDSIAECADFCDHAVACEEETSASECRERCNSALDRCLDTQDEDAREELTECSQVECDDVLSCSIEVGAECFFAIG